jgi:hypothetical protein
MKRRLCDIRKCHGQNGTAARRASEADGGIHSLQRHGDRGATARTRSGASGGQSPPFSGGVAARSSRGPLLRGAPSAGDAIGPAPPARRRPQLEAVEAGQGRQTRCCSPATAPTKNMTRSKRQQAGRRTRLPQLGRPANSLFTSYQSPPGPPSGGPAGPTFLLLLFGLKNGVHLP